MALAYIGLGSNVGKRDENLRQAIEMLGQEDGIESTRVSSFYETRPVGYLDQRDFLNGVVEIETSLSPQELLAATKMIEAKQKRVRKVRWGPRTIDLDILLYDNIELTDANLKLPHPEVSKRAFVLVPLAELVPEKRLPGGMSVSELLAELGEIEGVKPFDKRGGSDNVHN